MTTVSHTFGHLLVLLVGLASLLHYLAVSQSAEISDGGPWSGGRHQVLQHFVGSLRRHLVLGDHQVISDGHLLLPGHGEGQYDKLVVRGVQAAAQLLLTISPPLIGRHRTGKIYIEEQAQYLHSAHLIKGLLLLEMISNSCYFVPFLSLLLI